MAIPPSNAASTKGAIFPDLWPVLVTLGWGPERVPLYVMLRFLPCTLRPAATLSAPLPPPRLAQLPALSRPPELPPALRQAEGLGISSVPRHLAPVPLGAAVLAWSRGSPNAG